MSKTRNNTFLLKRREMANIGKNASLARHMFANLGVAIGEMEKEVYKPYVDRFLEISEMYYNLTDTDDVLGIKIRNRIAALMLEIEKNNDFYFRYKITIFRIGENITYRVTPTERKISI